MPVDISQVLILKTFTTYLKGRSEDDYDQTILKRLIGELNEGFCHGFSVVYAAMHRTGMGVWWEEVLKAISTWDGKQESLDKKINITVEGEEKKFPLEKLFENSNYFSCFSSRATVIEKRWKRS